METPSPETVRKEYSAATRLVQAFLKGNLPILVMVVSIAAGIFALLKTPREEEPQIVVPLADIAVSYPGGSASEVERLVASRLERMLYQIAGVEYVYSISMPEKALVTVRFFVGENREDSLIKLHNQLAQNMDKVTPGIAGWIVKPIEIDDVPILNATLHSARYDTHALRRLAEEMVIKLQTVPDSAKITIHGGEPRTISVTLDRERLGAYGLTPLEVAGGLRAANVRLGIGALEQANATVRLDAGAFLGSIDDVSRLVVGVYANRPVYLRDVATIQDGPAELAAYTRFGFGPAGTPPAGEVAGQTYPAVTIAVAKKTGSNAVRVADDVRQILDELRGTLIPEDVAVSITRDFGATANEKVNELVSSLALAILTVIGLLAIMMSWREGLIVALAVPLTYSLALLCNYMLGYTINRVTLFALILALGLLVDDPIVGVENIQRHLRLRRGGNRRDCVVGAMDEVMSPLIMSTLAIMVAFIPMFFITGMMGPYMAPMALNVPIAVLASTLVALTVTPWLSSRLLRVEGLGGGELECSNEPYDLTQTRLYRVYNRLLGPLVDSRRNSVLLLAGVSVLFVISVALALGGGVPLKMLPFDNKNEFQIAVDMPESVTLETTDAVTRRLEAYLQTIPEVTDFTTTVGAASPMDFNGLVRHYYLRGGPHVADLRVGLLPRKEREMDSHAITLRIRADVDRLAAETGANIKLIEAPPGPPVFSTLVAEVYGTAQTSHAELIQAAGIVRTRMAQEPGVVDLDDSVEAPHQRLLFTVDQEKAAQHGITVENVTQTLRLALGGLDAGVLHIPTEQNEVPIHLRLAREARSDPALLRALEVKGVTGQRVPVGELGTFVDVGADPAIYHKNQKRVVYVGAEMAGRGPAYAVLALQSHFKKHPLPEGIRIDWRGEGEWKITVDVFRDLGIAFAAALLGIFVLLVFQTGSFMLPVVVMLSIPLTMIGIMPGFWLLNRIMDRPVGGFDNPVFFTATAMIGMIALSGIVIRNGLVLIEFIRDARAQGRPLREALIASGAVRLRPIVLTAGTSLLGAWPITLDPIFSGLAWALIFGLLVSTAFTLVVIPVVYNLLYATDDKGGVV